MTEIDVVDFDHVAIRTTDLEETLRFYRELLGLRIRDEDRFERGEVPFVSVVVGGRHIHVNPVDEPFDVGREHLCLLLRSSEMDSYDELLAVQETLRDAGIELEHDEPQERVGAYGRGWAIYAYDPDGRRIELKMH